MNYPDARTIRQYQRMIARSFPDLRPITTPVADVNDADAFPEIAKAREYLDSLPPERREQLEREWEQHGRTG